MAIEVEQWLEEHVEAQRVVLAEGTCETSVPPIAFDRVFVAYHAAIHAGIGLSLQHLCDMAVLFKQEGEWPEDLSDRRFFHPAMVFAQLCNQYLGTDVPVRGDDKIADEAMKEILRAPYHTEVPYANAIQSGIYKAKRTLHCLRIKRRLLKPTWGEMVLPLLKIIVKQPGRLIR